jgi:hypothetical protein
VLPPVTEHITAHCDIDRQTDAPVSEIGPKLYGRCPDFCPGFFFRTVILRPSRSRLALQA